MTHPHEREYPPHERTHIHMTHNQLTHRPYIDTLTNLQTLQMLFAQADAKKFGGYAVVRLKMAKELATNTGMMNMFSSKQCKATLTHDGKVLAEWEQHPFFSPPPPPPETNPSFSSSLSPPPPPPP